MNAAVIVAGGNGTRMKLKDGESKQFLQIGGVPVLIRTLCAFLGVRDIDLIVLVTRASDIEQVKSLTEECSFDKTVIVTEGGATRQESVFRGIEAVFVKCADCGVEKLLIHDGARPFVTDDCINGVLEALDTYKAAAAGVQVVDTIKQISSGDIIEKTIDREKLISIQTPQGFNASFIYSVHKMAREYDINATDDCALVEELTDEKIKVTKGSYDNIKITNPEDIALGERIIEKQNEV